MKSTRTLIVAGLLVAGTSSGLAVADEARDPPLRKPQVVVEISPQLKAELQALQEAGRPSSRVRTPEASEPMPGFTVQARLESIVDGRLRVSVPITPDEVGRLTGAREVTSPDEIGDNTVFQGRLYTSYPLLDLAAETGLIPVVGEGLVLELKRGPQDIAFVVGWRKS